MRKIMNLCSVCALLVLLNLACFAQDDEIRQGTGLPMQIGENAARGGKMNVSGQVTLQGFDKSKQLPVVTIRILFSGVTTDQTTAKDTGFYVVRNVPRENVVLVVEIDGAEVARQPIIASPMGNPRVDITVPMTSLRSTSTPAVVDANAAFPRTRKSEELYQQALSAVKAKDAKKAVSLFNQVLEAEPKDFVAWTELGTLYFRENSLDNAEACYFKAIELKRDYALALLNLGKLYMSKKQYDNAVLTLSNAAKSSPDSPDVHHYLGESYLQVKKGSLAVGSLNEAIRLAPDEKADLHLRLASLYDSAGMKAKAAAEYKAFLAKRPSYAEKQALVKYIRDHESK